MELSNLLRWLLDETMTGESILSKTIKKVNSISKIIEENINSEAPSLGIFIK